MGARLVRLVLVAACLAIGASDALADSAAKVVAGLHHTCALTPAGGVECWGYNFAGQLGDGTTTNRSTPTAVAGLSSGVAALAAGYGHMCVLTTGGGVVCWGFNAYGQLGDATTTDRLTPTPVSGLSSGVAAIATGTYHTCAVKTDGGAVCWGWNYSGQLGDGTTTSRSAPTAVFGLSSGVAALAAGSAHACALTTGGGVVCWGAGGKIGDGTTTTRLRPTGVSGLSSGIAALAAGNGHTCALTTGSGVLCWGDNFYGQLGDGTTTTRLTPVAASGLSSGVAAIATGEGHTCAVTTGGSVLCWGDNDYGQLGDGTTTDRWTPTAVSELASGVLAIAAGGGHTCALTAGWGVVCWGRNFAGQLGDGTTTNRWVPTTVSGLEGNELESSVAVVTARQYHTCALTGAGGAVCWGDNDNGQLGDGTTTRRSTPTVVSGLASGVAAVAPGYYHTCALTTVGGALCWGSNGNGQLGDGTTTQSTTPVAVSGLSSAVGAIVAGGYHSCAVTSSGAARCWGRNNYGQLGDGTTTDRVTPTAVSGLSSGVAAIATGIYHTCALTTGGGVVCWGYNSYGQLGDGTTTDRWTPTAVSGLSNGIAAIAADHYHACARTTAGGALCWGNNSYGQLGDGTTTSRATPTAVSGLSSGVAAIEPGGRHTCVRTTGGGVMCWGYNVLGELGDGTTTQRLTPTAVSGLTSGAAAIAAGYWHTCAVTAGGDVACWGDNNYGDLGDGATLRRTTAIGVSGLSSGIVAVAGGGVFHSCAITTGQGLVCWGDNSAGQLGVGTSEGRRPTPVAVTGLATGVSGWRGVVPTPAR